MFGHRAHARLAQRCGIQVDVLLPFPRTMRRRGPRGFGAMVAALERTLGGFDVLHAWTLRTGRLASMCLPDAPCAVTAMAGPRHASFLERVASLRTASKGRAAPLRVLAANECVVAELLLAGADPSVVRLVAPGVDAALLDAQRQPAREILRERWGVDDATLLVGLITHPVQWGDARAAASIVTLPVTANRNVKLLVHPDAARLKGAYEWSRPLGLDHRLIQEPDLAEPWRVLAGLDVALWIGNERTAYEVSNATWRQPLPMVQPMLWAMAAGLPVVAERCGATSELIERGGNGVLIEPRDVPAGARQIVALYDDAALRRSLGEAARNTIESQFTIAQAAQRVRRVYDELRDDDRTDRNVETSKGQKETLSTTI